MSDIVERLRHFCTDWDGSAMDDHTEPMPGLHCIELREAADEIERLRALAVALSAPIISYFNPAPDAAAPLVNSQGDKNAK